MFPAQLLCAKALRQGWTCPSRGRSSMQKSSGCLPACGGSAGQPYRGGAFSSSPCLLGGPGAPGQCGGVWSGCPRLLAPLGRRLYKPPDMGVGHSGPQAAGIRPPPPPVRCPAHSALCHTFSWTPQGGGRVPSPLPTPGLVMKTWDSLGGPKTELQQFLGISATRFPSEDTGPENVGVAGAQGQCVSIALGHRPSGPIRRARGSTPVPAVASLWALS